MRVKLTKISGNSASHIKPGYWVDGECGHVVLGANVFLSPINATSLNDRFDYFRTTDVTDLSEDGSVITTKNSKWKFEIIK